MKKILYMNKRYIDNKNLDRKSTVNEIINRAHFLKNSINDIKIF